jgi:predicted kinase/predicted MPP superfamily phosphohydrolase
MRSLIILKGLVKDEKLNWVKNEKLENYFIDIDLIRKVYAIPELLYPGREILNKSFSDLVYRRFIEIICTKMSKGGLIVVDTENEANNFLETIALIFGYTIFYVVQDIPKDYTTEGKKYTKSYYQTKRKPELEHDILNYTNFPIKEDTIIKSYNDVLEYWKKKRKFYTPNADSKILHVSDLHSNFKLFKKLPKFSSYDLVIFYGDYIDGPEKDGSRKITDHIIKDKKEKFIWLEGNHELRLRKYLGYLMLKDGNTKKELKEYLLRTLPEDFLNITAKEYNDLDNNQARVYLEKLNKKLNMSISLTLNKNKFICTHAGIKYIDQIDPRYIGSLVYGSRDMNRFDKEFTEVNKNNNIWSVHAHCQYPDSWEVFRFPKVVNLDPPTENEIVYAEQDKKGWKVCVIEK